MIAFENFFCRYFDNWPPLIKLLLMPLVFLLTFIHDYVYEYPVLSIFTFIIIPILAGFLWGSYEQKRNEQKQHKKKQESEINSIDAVLESEITNSAAKLNKVNSFDEIKEHKHKKFNIKVCMAMVLINHIVLQVIRFLLSIPDFINNMPD